MRVLALETSAKACSAAVTEDGRVLASAFQCTSLTHSRTLMPMVEAMLKNADLILVVRGGNVVESGTHRELMAKGGFYREMYDAQFH